MKTLEDYLLETMRSHFDNEDPCVGFFQYDSKTHKISQIDEQTSNIISKETKRGQVLYDVENDSYKIYVGSWIKDYNDAIDLIVDEFHLNEAEYEVEISSHLELVMGLGD